MVLEFLSNIGNVFLLLLAIIFIYIMTRTRCITYYIQDSATNPEFKVETRDILKNSAINNRYRIVEVANQSEADIIVELRARASLNDYHKKPEYYPGTNKQIRFSLTWQQPKPYVAIDDINWTYSVPESGLSIPEYRKYVIQHEFMHALGFDHQPCNADTVINGRCPVLYQATRGPPAGFQAGYEVIPIDYTKKLENSYF